jgi:hypothetical protein
MPKRVIVKSEGVELTDVRGEQVSHIKDSKRSYKKLRHSNFHLTVNTNQRHNAESEELVAYSQKLKSAASQILEEIGQYVIFLEGGASFTPEWIKEVKTKGAVVSILYEPFC